MAEAILCSFLFFIKKSLAQPPYRTLFCMPRP